MKGIGTWLIGMFAGFVIGAGTALSFHDLDEPAMRAAAQAACQSYGLTGPDLNLRVQAAWLDCMYREMDYQRSIPQNSAAVLWRWLTQEPNRR